MTRWHICCPGPSLEWSWWRGQRQVLCVNYALKEAKECAYWISMDHPNDVHRACFEDWERLRPPVVTKPKRFVRWQKALPEVEICNILDSQHAWPWKVDRCGLNLSIQYAWAWAALQGATVLEFHGVDLAGQGYVGGADPRYENNPRASENTDSNRAAWWRKRWDKGKDPDEIDLMRVFYKEARKRGVIVEGLPGKVTDGIE